VFATDLYLDPQGWDHTATSGMLIEPQQFWAGPSDLRRLVVQHMDALELRYAENSFDGVFSSSSIEHFGGLDAVAKAMNEMHRVLRPGGVASLSTEFRLGGPPPGLPGILMFDRDQIIGSIVGNREWELVGGALELQPSQSTLDVRVPFASAVADIENGAPHWSVYPHLVLEQEPVVWTSVHLALRKPE
jgi:SAM-dependent methyltransferase